MQIISICRFNPLFNCPVCNKEYNYDDYYERFNKTSKVYISFKCKACSKIISMMMGNNKPICWEGK